MDKSRPPPTPEVFEFVGIRYDKEKEKAERERWKAESGHSAPHRLASLGLR